MITALVDRILRFDRALHDHVDYRALVPLRIVTGPIVLIHLWPELVASLGGRTHVDGFISPYGTWYPQVPSGSYVTMLWLAAVAAIMVSVGLLTRTATVWTAAFVGYHLFLSRTHYHHNRAFLFVLLIGLSLVPVGRVVSVDALVARMRRRLPSARGRRWPLTALRFQVAAVYVASGVSKMLDPDWFGGTVTRLRVEAGIGDVVGGPLSTVATASWFHAGFAKVVVLTEILIGIGLLTPRLRLGAIWLALAFHLAIEATADVEVFSLAAVAALVIWVTPNGHDRLLRVPAAGPRRWVERAVRWLDWTGRFRLVRDGSAFDAAVVDRDGSLHAGDAAGLLVLTRLPATFWFAAPWSLIVHAARPAATTRRA